MTQEVIRQLKGLSDLYPSESIADLFAVYVQNIRSKPHPQMLASLVLGGVTCF
jgi:hypothetical protein